MSSPTGSGGDRNRCLLRLRPTGVRSRHRAGAIGLCRVRGPPSETGRDRPAPAAAARACLSTRRWPPRSPPTSAKMPTAAARLGARLRLREGARSDQPPQVAHAIQPDEDLAQEPLEAGRLAARLEDSDRDVAHGALDGRELEGSRRVDRGRQLRKLAIPAAHCGGANSSVPLISSPVSASTARSSR